MRKQHYLLLPVLIACFSLQVSAQVNLQQGLVAYYPFNGNANDESGNGNNGVVYGATLTEDRFGNANSAYYFNGSNTLIEVPHSASLCPPDAVTISAWAFPLNVQQWHQIITKRFNHSSSPYNSYILETTHEGINNRWGFSVVTGPPWGGVGLYSLQALAPNIWVYLVGTYDGQYVKFYYNGELISSAPQTGNIGYSTLSLRIGQAIPSGGQQNFYGKIDDIRIYNRALTEQEVYALYTEGQPPQTNTITNILINPRTNGSGLVDVYFNLNGMGSQYSIALAASFDGGNSYTAIPSSFLNGDVSSISPGTNKLIVWDGLGSHPNTYSTATKLKIIAN